MFDTILFVAAKITVKSRSDSHFTMLVSYNSNYNLIPKSIQLLNNFNN